MEKILSYLNLGIDFVDSGRFFRNPFKWIYYLIGIANFAIPFMLITNLINQSKWMDGKTIFMLVLLAIFSLAVAFITCYWWFKRGNSLTVDAKAGSRFVAIPMIANITQTAGEVAGIWVGVFGFLVVLVSLLFAGSYELNEVSFGYGIWGLVIYPIFGYLIVLFSRFLAELYLALASIANNTRSIDDKLTK